MPDATPIVFVVHEDAPVCASVEGLIQGAGLRSEIFGSAREFLAHPRPSTPSCLVLDLRLPDLSGLELQARIAAERHEMPIIFVTGCGDVPTTVRAMKAGALEFLTKPFDAGELLNAVRTAIERSRMTLAREASLRLLRERHASLTHRERQVMALIVVGRLNKQVGGELGISELTVKAHRGRVMRKMKACSFAQLIDIARALGLTFSLAPAAAPEGRRPARARLSLGDLHA